MPTYEMRCRKSPTVIVTTQQFEAEGPNEAILTAQGRARRNAFELWEDGRALFKLALAPVGDDEIWTIRRPDQKGI